MEIQAILLARPEPAGSGVSAEPLLELARLADRAPVIRRVAVGDHQGNYLETYTALGHLAGVTERVELGPYVTNVVGRDPGVHAAALSSLDALSGGRAYAVLGRGDGALRNLGLSASTLDTMREAVTVMRALLATGSAETQSGRRIRLNWPRYPVDVPLYLAASGPRMTELAAETADGLYTATGLLPENIERLRDRIHAGRARTGRADDLEVWWVTRFGLGRTRLDAMGLVREGLSSIGNHALRGAAHDELDVPEGVRGALDEYHRRYDYARKSVARPGPSNADLMEALGLENYFLERFGIVGTAAEVSQRLADLAERGVDRIVINIHTLDELRMLIEDVVVP
jgi:5,10-methylenetetrahydromethanopterin reductase